MQSHFSLKTIMRVDQFYQQCNSPSAQICLLENEGQAKMCKWTVFTSTEKITVISPQLLVPNDITCDYLVNILKITGKGIML